MVIWVRHMCFVFLAEGLYLYVTWSATMQRESCSNNHTKHNSFPFFTISCIQQNCCLKNDTSRKRHAKNCLYFLLEIKTIMNNKSYVKPTKKYLSVKKDRINYQNEKNKNKSSYLKKGVKLKLSGKKCKQKMS